MHSYHVYFDAKPDVPTEALIAQVHLFMRLQLLNNYVVSYRLLNMTNKASFKDIPDFHLIVDYQSEETLNLGFNKMKEIYMEEPHKTLLAMVSNFRVAFSIDEIRAEQDAAANP